MAKPTQDDLILAISEIFAPLEVSADSTLDSLEATSVSLLRLMAMVQRQFHVELDVVDMYTIEVISDLIKLIEERISNE